MTRTTTRRATKPKPQRDRTLPQGDAAIAMLGLDWLGLLLDGGEGAAAAQAGDAYHSARAGLRETGTPAAIDRLSALFELAPFDEDMLLLALAAQLRGRPKQATAHLLKTALNLTGDEAEALLWQRLAPQAPLRRFHLIEANERPVSATTPLYIDERIGRFLLGEDRPDVRLTGLMTATEGGPCPRRHEPGLASLIDRMKRDGAGLAMIVGPKHSGRRAVAERLARSLGMGLAEARPRLLEAPELVPVLAREAVLARKAMLVDAGAPEGRRLIEEQLAEAAVPVIAIAEARHDLAGDPAVLRLDPLEPEDRLQLWNDAIGPHRPEMNQAIADVASQFRFGPRAIASAVRQGGDLWQACRERASRELDELAERIVPHYTWDDIVLPGEVVHDLKAAAAQVRHQALVYGRYGYARRYPRGRGVSLLMSGSSGTGKTMAAEVIAGDLDLDLYRIDLSQVVSKYIGETEKNLRAVFDAAEASGAVLLFDEADALFGKRSEVKDSHDRYANIEVSYLLQRMESYGGLAILATNAKGRIDAAFLRRLRYVVDVPFPDATARRAIWRKAIPAEMPCERLDFDALARLDIAGGNIAVIAINAGFLAAGDGGPLTMQHIARAARAEFRKLDRELRLNLNVEASR